MTNEHKRALIEDCKREIAHLKRCIEAYPDAPVLKSDLMRQEIALAALTAQPVLYALRFKNDCGQPDKLINENCLFRSREEASKYGKGGNYVTQQSGKIEWVPNPLLDPEVVPLFAAIYEVQE